MKLTEGTKAPEFSLISHTGNAISLSDYLNKQAIVLFFYPKDDSPICTKEVCSFRDAYESFTDLGAAVLGVSSDSEESHQAFASRQRVPFPLLADKDGKLRKAFGVPKTFGLVEGRVTYVIDKHGVIKKIFNSQLASNKHMEEALAMIKTLAA